MIDPVRITDFNRTQNQLEELLLFCIAVAGKKASTTSGILEKFLNYGRKTPDESPFKIILMMAKKNSDFAEFIRSFGFGCVTMKSKGFVEAAQSGLDLKTCTVQELEKIHGIGMKTSRFFVLHSRKTADIACLDTHVLKYLKDLGYDVPKSTPPKNKYLKIEKQFIELTKPTGIASADLDLMIWNVYSGSLESEEMQATKKFLKAIKKPDDYIFS